MNESGLKKFLSREMMRFKSVYRLPKWSRIKPLGTYLARRRPMLRPSVLLISLPRSGSSWVGEILGSSPTAAYLREPINQSRKVRRPGDPSIFEITPAQIPAGNLSKMKFVTDKVFLGIPNFPLRVVKYPDQWTYHKRSFKRIVVKEINPMALEWLIKQYDLRVIYLIRHPPAVANSFHRIGWAGAQLEPRFSKSYLTALKQDYRPFLSSFWTEHAALQAIVHTFVDTTFKKHDQHIVIKYEDLCKQPLESFRKLYTFAELEWTDKIKVQIELSAHATHQIRSDIYGTVRHSKKMTTIWKKEISPKTYTRYGKHIFILIPPITDLNGIFRPDK